MEHRKLQCGENYGTATHLFKNVWITCNHCIGTKETKHTIEDKPIDIIGRGKPYETDYSIDKEFDADNDWAVIITPSLVLDEDVTEIAWGYQPVEEECFIVYDIENNKYLNLWFEDGNNKCWMMKANTYEELVPGISGSGIINYKGQLVGILGGAVKIIIEPLDQYEKQRTSAYAIVTPL